MGGYHGGYQYRPEPQRSAKRVGPVMFYLTLIVLISAVFVFPPILKRSSQALQVSKVEAEIKAAAEARAQEKAIEKAKRDLMRFLKKHSHDPALTKMSWYTRTLNVMEQCGNSFTDLRLSYEDNNYLVYEENLDRVASRPRSSPQYVQPQRSKSEEDEDWDLFFTDDNPFAKDRLDPSPTKYQCEIIKAEVEAGRLDL